MKLILSSDAKEDLQNISDHTYHNWGVEKEVAYLKSIYKRFDEIKTEPHRWKRRDDLFLNCQSVPVGKHIIFLIILEDQILISRILHEAMDIPAQFLPV